MLLGGHNTSMTLKEDIAGEVQLLELAYVAYTYTTIIGGSYSEVMAERGVLELKQPSIHRISRETKERKRD